MWNINDDVIAYGDEANVNKTRTTVESETSPVKGGRSSSTIRRRTPTRCTIALRCTSFGQSTRARFRANGPARVSLRPRGVLGVRPRRPNEPNVRAIRGSPEDLGRMLLGSGGIVFT